MPRPPNLGCHSTCKLYRAYEHTANGILGFAASASASLRIGVGIGVEPVGLGVASGVGCGGVRRWRRCPAAAAVAAATAAASTAVELAAGRGVGGGNGGGWLARRHETADSLLCAAGLPISGKGRTYGTASSTVVRGKGAAGRRAARRRTARWST